MVFERKTLRAFVTAAVLVSAALGAYVAAQSAEPKERVIRVTVKKFNYTPDAINLKKGVPVILEFKTLDILMGFNLPDFNLRADIVPDKITRLRLVPEKAGTFIFLCDIFCGTGHEEMNGRIIVTD